MRIKKTDPRFRNPFLKGLETRLESLSLEIRKYTLDDWTFKKFYSSPFLAQTIFSNSVGNVHEQKQFEQATRIQFGAIRGRRCGDVYSGTSGVILEFGDVDGRLNRGPETDSGIRER